MASRKYSIRASAALLAVLGSPTCADNIRVAVASNFRPALAEIGGLFEQMHEHRVDLIPGSTGKHYAQIMNGAPFDIFLAADAARPARLEADERIVPGSRFTYALGQLVLWSRNPDLVDPAGKILASDTDLRLAIANPRLAPYGQAAREVLTVLGIWEPIQHRLVTGENVAQAFLFAYSGGAQLGFVAWSQLHTADGIRSGSHWLVPRTLYRPIEQQAVLLKDGAAARAFLVFLQSPNVMNMIRDFGYATPP